MKSLLFELIVLSISGRNLLADLIQKVPIISRFIESAYHKACVADDPFPNDSEMAIVLLYIYTIRT